MYNEQIKILTASLKRLLRRGATKQLLNILKKTHMADLSTAFKELSADNRERLFRLMNDPEQIGLLFSMLDENIFLEFVKNVELSKLVDIFDHMPSDDAASLLNLLDEELSDQILSKMQKEESDNVEQLMSYGEDTAGSLMVTDFIALEEDMGAKQVIEALQNKYLDVEMPFYIYVVDEYGKLVGVSSLRQLVVVHPQLPLKEFMAKDLVSVKPYTDREEVARLVSRYDYLAVPVVDNDNRIVGIVTVDDVIDILHEAADEDILKMAGVGEEYIETQTVFRGTRIRLPWLFASFLGGVAAFFIIGGFEENLVKFTSLAAFIPVIMGMGGNIGTQSSTIVVRGIATGRINLQDFFKVVSKELAVGVILGVIYGVFIGVIAKLTFASEPFSLPLAFSVGLAIISSMSIAALVGSMVPLIFERLNIDPAVATGPFVTTSIDIVSVYCYFTIAGHLLNL
ncbi:MULTISPECIES: magnesium transporter [Desulfobacula]|uniref:Magnesium transporter MgtE n=2 Tax=Desulfobacula TaxID=28222 RepID=K0NGM7_DESTT|nr:MULTISPECIES: magnesium transporter [Desulfobacula]CCK80386.1 MgtE: magnesium transporter [Desulfobacula toluolica Tol2]SDT98777.1 magnesium transporter [Desulfobacula phenolica]